MNITRQSSPNECGVCVLTSLFETLHKKPIDKISVLNKANIQERGLSLYDFEHLANSLNMNTEVYELE
jgi:ABC-type bacteriocin/lantibiotic exporter with double-glycine peptidase domain